MFRWVWRLKVFGLLALLVVLSGAAPYQEPEMGGPPVHFRIVDPEAISRGACATLVWELPPDIKEDWPIFIDGRPVERRGEMRVCPEETTTYHLLAETPEGPREFELTLQVAGEPGPAPGEPRPEPWKHEAGATKFPIHFSANPDALVRGQCAVLNWGMPEGDWMALLDGQPIPFMGEMQVCPEDTRAYELLVESPAGLKTATVTVQVAAQAEPPVAIQPTIPAEPVPAEPVLAEPVLAEPAPAGAGFSADLRPSDLYADNQPQGMMWGRITNDGPGALTGQKVWVSGSGTAMPRVGGGPQPLSFVATEYTLNIAPGQTQTLYLSWPVDTSQYSYEFTLLVQAIDFADPNPSNDSYSEAVTPAGPVVPAPTAAPPSQPPAPGGALSADVKPTDLYPDGKVNGVMWVRVSNRGPGALQGNKVGVFGYVTETPLGGGQPQGKALPEQEFTLSITPGQEQQIKLGWPVDLSKHKYDFSVTVKVKDFSDPDPGNNTYSERIEDASQPVIPAPPPNVTQTIPGLKADIAPVSMTAAYGTFHVKIRNNGPDILNNQKAQWTLSFSGTDANTGTKAAGVQQGSATLNLSSGVEDFVDTGVKYDLVKFSHYNLTVDIKPQGFADPNMGNNSYTQRIPKQ